MEREPILLEGSGARNGFVRALIDKLFRQRVLLLGLLALWTVAMAAYVCIRPPKYEHEIRFLVRNNRVGAAITPESNDGPIYRDYIDETMLTTEIEMLSSRSLMRSIVEQCQLAVSDDPEDVDEALEYLEDELKVGRVQKANVIKATYSAKDPSEIKAVLTTLADGYLAEHLRAHSTKGAHELFDEQAEHYEKRLTELQDRLTEFQESRGIVLLGQQKDLGVKRYLELEAELKGAQTARVENARKIARLKDQLGSLEERVTTQSREVPNQYSIERLNTMLVELKNRRTQLLTKFQADDRLVKEVDKQIADTRSALDNATESIAREQSSDINPIRQNVEKELVDAQVREAEYEARIAGLRSRIQEMRGSLDGLRDSTAEEERLMRQLKEAEDNFFLYSKKREDARIENAMDRERIANVILIEPPRAPLVPEPRISLTLIATYLLGCLMISGLGLVKSLGDETVYTIWELEGVTGSPVLASIPLDAPRTESGFFLALQPKSSKS